MDDECRIRQTNTNCTIDIFIGSKPAEEFDVCLDRFLQNENSREREIKVVEMIGKQEYLDELKPYEIGSWGDTFVSSSIHYHSPDEHTETDEVNEFLAHFNECHKRGILVIGTTNRKDIIDPAALRAGRFDIQIEIPAPDDELRQRLFEMYLRNRPLAEDIDIPELAAKTKRYSCSDIPFVVNEAALAAAIADEPISQEHLMNVISSHRSSLESTIRPIGFDR